MILFPDSAESTVKFSFLHEQSFKEGKGRAIKEKKTFFNESLNDTTIKPIFCFALILVLREGFFSRLPLINGTVYENVKWHSV